MCSCLLNVFSSKDLNTPPVDDCYQVLMNLADMNLAVLKGTDPSTLEQSIRTKITGKLFLKWAWIFIREYLGLVVTLRAVNILQVWFIFGLHFFWQTEKQYSSSTFITARVAKIFELIQWKQGCEEKKKSGVLCLVKDIFNDLSVKRCSQSEHYGCLSQTCFHIKLYYLPLYYLLWGKLSQREPDVYCHWFDNTTFLYICLCFGIWNTV